MEDQRNAIISQLQHASICPAVSHVPKIDPRPLFGSPACRGPWAVLRAGWCAGVVAALGWLRPRRLDLFPTMHMHAWWCMVERAHAVVPSGGGEKNMGIRGLGHGVGTCRVLWWSLGKNCGGAPFFCGGSCIFPCG